MKKNELYVMDGDVMDLANKPTKIMAKDVSKLIEDNGNVNLTVLSDDENKRYGRLTRNMVVTDINSITNYGSELQTSMTKYSNDFLSAVRTQKSGEMGELITNLLAELDYIDVDELKAPTKIKRMLRKIPIVKHLVSSVEKVMGKYDTISKNVEEISNKILSTRINSLKDNNALQVMFENNIEYGKQIEEYIIAGKLKLEEVKAKYDEMIANKDNYEIYQIQDVKTFHDNLERRLNDMVTLRYVIKQSLPQIRMVQTNNLSVAEKAQQIVTTTIPVWKSQLSLAVAINRQSENIKAQKAVVDTTNSILKKNAEMLHQNSIIVAQENERSVIDIETLKETTQKLIDTFKEVKAIHDSGAALRKESEKELIRLEKELNGTLLSLSSSNSTKTDYFLG